MHHLPVYACQLIQAGDKAPALELWGGAGGNRRADLPDRLEAIAGREDGSVVYSPKPLACSISACEARMRACWMRERKG